MSDPRPDFPEPLVILPAGEHTHSFVILHGRGGTSEDFPNLSALHESGQRLQQLFPGMKFIFPVAKRRHLTAFNEDAVTIWFDVHTFDDVTEREDTQMEGLRETAAVVHALLDEEVARVGSHNLFLGGSSQGGSMGMYSLLSYQPEGGPLGGFVDLGGWLPCRNSFEDVAAFSMGETGLDMPSLGSALSSNTRTDVLIAHGENDEVIPEELGTEAASTLERLGMNVTMKTYKGLGHWMLRRDVVRDVMAFLQGKCPVSAEALGELMR